MNIQLHSAQDAIKQAIEGGWKPKELSIKYKNVEMKSAPSEGAILGYLQDEAKMALAFLDPLYWQALGKVRGWIPSEYPDGEMRCTAKRCTNRWCGYAGFVDPKDIARLWFENRQATGDEKKFWESLR